MIRVVIENILLFLLPTVLYITYVLLTRGQDTSGSSSTASGAARALDDAPLLWLFVAGAALVIATLVVFGSTSGGKPGQHYEPPAMKDGKIEPGHIN